MVRWNWLGGFGWAVGLVCAGAGGCGEPILSVDDAVMLGGEKVRLVAHAERREGPLLRKEMEGVRVRFFVNEQEAGSARTNEDGRASIKCGVPAEGDSRFEARALVEGVPLQTAGWIFAWRKDRTIVAVDIDGTISNTDYEDLFLKKRDEDSDPVKRSRQTLAKLAEDFHITYVTARPRVLVEKTRKWLKENEFPAGPVVTAPRLRDVILQTRFKRRVLADLRDDWPNLRIGIGDHGVDAEAYGANRMLTLIVDESTRHRHRPHAVVLRDWKEVNRFFAANHDTLTRPEKLIDATDGKVMLLQAVRSWEEGD